MANRNSQPQSSISSGGGASPPGEAACPICGQPHSELVAALFQEEAARVPGPELVELRDWLRLQRAQARAEGNGGTEWGLALLHRLRAVEGELARRRKLRRWGAPSVPSQGYYGPGVLAQIKKKVLITEAAEMVGLEVLPGSGDRLRYRCPAHGDGIDRNPSGTLYLHQNRFWCFACNSGGDIFDMMVAFGRVGSFREAVEVLAKQGVVDLSQPRRGKTVAGVSIVHD